MSTKPAEIATAYAYLNSPIGLVEVASDGRALIAANFVESARAGMGSDAVVAAAVDQLSAYFAGDRKDFDLPISLIGTIFQRSVWQQLLAVAFGETAAYRDIALALEKPNAVRAVGAANGQNPISIIVPCHRIIGSNGALTGYGGGLWRKEWLLRHEGALLI